VFVALKSPLFLLVCLILPLPLSAHEPEIMLFSEITEDGAHDDLAPTIKEEIEIVEGVGREQIGYNPEIKFEEQATIFNETAHIDGQWSGVQNWSVVPVFVSLLYNDRVLAFDSVGDEPTESYQNHNFTRATVWNPTTNQFTDAQVDTGYNIFCSGFASLPDGRLFVTVGHGHSHT
jgi:hypothetical protein